MMEDLKKLKRDLEDLGINLLKIGDEVLWRGTFGMESPKKVKVIGIEITHGGKYGDEVDAVDWKEVYGRNVTVDLDNNHWAYAEQISKLR